MALSDGESPANNQLIKQYAAHSERWGSPKRVLQQADALLPFRLVEGDIDRRSTRSANRLADPSTAG